MSVEAKFAPYCDKVVEFHQYRQEEVLTAAEARTDPDTFQAFCEAAQLVADIPELGMVYRGVLTARGEKRQKAMDRVRSIELSIAAGLLDAEIIGDEAYTRRRTQLQKPAEVIRYAKSFDKLFAKVLPAKPKRSVRRRAQAVASAVVDQFTPDPSPLPVDDVTESATEPIFELPPVEAVPPSVAAEVPLSFLPEPEDEPATAPELVLISSEDELEEPALPVVEETPLEPSSILSEDEAIAVFAQNVLVGIRNIERNGEGVRESYLRQKLKHYLMLDEGEVDYLFDDFKETGQLRVLRQDRLDGTFWTSQVEPIDLAM